ncbi:hypothetical protein ACFP4F_19525, partial [Streptomyces ochraceiscleroticus]
MRKFIGRFAATAALTAAAVVPLSGVASAQTPAAAPTTASAAGPCGWGWGYDCWGWHDGWHHHDHNLINVDLGL